MSQPTKENVRKAWEEGCGDVKKVLERLFPDCFEKPKSVSLKDLTVESVLLKDLTVELRDISPTQFDVAIFHKGEIVGVIEPCGLLETDVASCYFRCLSDNHFIKKRRASTWEIMKG